MKNENPIALWFRYKIYTLPFLILMVLNNKLSPNGLIIFVDFALVAAVAVIAWDAHKPVIQRIIIAIAAGAFWTSELAYYEGDKSSDLWLTIGYNVLVFILCVVKYETENRTSKVNKLTVVETNKPDSYLH